MDTDSQAPIAISVRGVSKTFGGKGRRSGPRVTALDGVSMELDVGSMSGTTRGMMHGVIGPEGAGKTTLMRILLQLMRPVSGEIRYFKGATEVSFEEIRPAVAYMPQQQSLYPDLSIGEHLDFFRVLYGIPDELYRQRSEELLRITRLAEFVKRPAGKLSGGMYKKLGLMCALLRSPRAVLLDEPTNGVDPISRREFWELLYRLADQEILIIVTTAYMDEAERCSWVHLMERGRLVAEGEPRELLGREGVRTFDELFLKHSEPPGPGEGMS